MCGGGHLLRRAEPSRSWSLSSHWGVFWTAHVSGNYCCVGSKFCFVGTHNWYPYPENQWQDSGVILLGLGGVFVAVWIGYVPFISVGTFLPLSFVLSLATMILVGGLLVYFSNGVSD